MKINFVYDKSKDIWCILNKGKSSNNSSKPTKQYELLIAKYTENPTTEDASAFIDEYIAENNIDIHTCIQELQTDWENISFEFQNRAEKIFGIPLPADITVYLTINGRRPYNIEQNFFYVSVESPHARKTIMHELWHFYTWYGLGTDQEEKIGKQKYNDLKEALTVLLNIECADLLPKGTIDNGYTQHKELRDTILGYWETKPDIHSLWDHFIS